MAERQAHQSSSSDEDLLGLYLHDIRSRPLLTREDEERLGRAIELGREASRELEENDGSLPPERRRALRALVSRCEQSTRQFVEANLRLVVSIAKRYRHSRMPLSDLVQEGNLGLLNAVRKFDYRKGFRFSTYATWWIRQAITRAMANSGRMIRLPADAGDRVLRIRRARSRLEAQYGRAPTEDELAAEVGMDRARMNDLLRSAAEPVSVSEGFGSDDGAELGHTIADPAAERSLEEWLDALTPGRVQRLLGLLNERERDILCLRFGLDGHEPRSRAAVGECLGVSGERVRQVEARALARLRTMPETGDIWESVRG